ncbi:response regulator [Chromatium okenii]|uniref:response regulator n=1 Tax=Chromatium okenii TaxID=61644 RepID=UPI003D6A43B0
MVDDSPSFRSYLQSLLDSYRYQTLTACHGREALELLAQHPDISLIITDVKCRNERVRAD